MDLKILFSRSNQNIKIPVKNEFKPGYDLYIDMEWFKKSHSSMAILKHGQSIRLSTGIKSIFPKEYYIQIEEKYSTGSIALKKSAGIIDSKYRGIWEVLVVNTSNKRIILCDNIIFNKLKEDKNYIEHNVLYNVENDSLFQFIIHKVPNVEFEEISEKDISNYKLEQTSVSRIKKLLNRIKGML